MREMAAEMIREQVLRQTREELPHSIAIAIETFEEPADQNQVVRIEATIYVDQNSQKPILVGKGGETIKNIGQKARQQIEAMIERKVFLGLQVKVKKNWRKDFAFLNTLHLAAPSKQSI
jgi:GTPase